MSLKDEIEKLINAEQSKFRDRDRKHAAHHERMRERFASLRVILEEITVSVDSKYLGSRFHDDSALFELGRIEGSSRSTDTRWKIEANYGIRSDADVAEGIYSDEPGFKVEETEYYNYPKYGLSQSTRVFENDRTLSEYLIRKIAEKVAHYRYLESLSAKQKEEK